MKRLDYGDSAALIVIEAGRFEYVKPWTKTAKVFWKNGCVVYEKQPETICLTAFITFIKEKHRTDRKTVCTVFLI